MALLKGGGKALEINLPIGRFWLAMAKHRIGFYAARVESKANIADGPTRHDLSEVEELGAQWCEPTLPSWAYDLWSIPRGA